MIRREMISTEFEKLRTMKGSQSCLSTGLDINVN
jgi:hypothetical protein